MIKDFDDREQRADCEHCGKGELVPVSVENYGSDRDGNRGIEMTTYVCNVCEEEFWG